VILLSGAWEKEKAMGQEQKVKIFTEVVKERRSGRNFDPVREVPSQILNQILEATRWAPSCYGDEPWRFILCEKGAPPLQNKSQTAYEAVLGALVPFNHKWAQNAPLLIVAVGSRFYYHKGQLNNLFAYDTGAASQTMALAAHAHGLMIHQMGGFDPAPLVRFFDIGEKYQILAVMALGYENTDAADAQGPRSRQPQESRFFLNTWNE
jgi:nitroreductase